MQQLPWEFEVFYDGNVRKIRCFCGEILDRSILSHFRKAHPKEWEQLCIEFITLKNKGQSSKTIIENYKTKDGKLLFTSSVVEREIRKLVEEEKAQLENLPKVQIDEWEPTTFELERTTVWSFRKRGEWAVHRNDYRGNWPPTVPRNLILKYSKEKDIILDPFVGGGTTLIEAWLTNRRSFGVDVSPIAVKTSTEKIIEMEHASKGNEQIQLDQSIKPVVIKGDARNVKQLLSKYNIGDNSVKLACLHPPYLNSLRYTEYVEEDLSRISDKDIFCDQLQRVASQVYDLLTDDGTCAVLMGDVRKNKRMVPLGFLTMESFKREGFALKDIIIKIQHKDSSTRFWYTRRDRIDFLMAHEYLFIFTK